MSKYFGLIFYEFGDSPNGPGFDSFWEKNNWELRKETFKEWDLNKHIV